MEEGQEEKKPEEVKKPERADFLKQARELADRNEAAVKRMEELVNRNEELAAERMLGGNSEAGQPVEQKKEPEGLEYLKTFKEGMLGNG
jgi:hypothetical protein